MVAFEEIVEKRNAKGGAIEWTTPPECEHYVDRLQQAASRLAHENRQLRRVHDALGASVLQLMDVDMLKQRALWKAQFGEMQRSVEQLAERYPRERMAKWVMHWDHQVYKVLEAAYRTGLETLNESLQLPESLKVELALAPSQTTADAQTPPEKKQAAANAEVGASKAAAAGSLSSSSTEATESAASAAASAEAAEAAAASKRAVASNAPASALVFRPPLEELRSLYYRELKKFVSVPASFKGLDGTNAEVYHAMAGHNTASLVRVYHKAELLLRFQRHTFLLRDVENSVEC